MNRSEITAAYLEAHAQSLTILGQIETAIQNKPAPDADVYLDWGHVGDMQKLNHDLREILRYLKP